MNACCAWISTQKCFFLLGKNQNSLDVITEAPRLPNVFFQIQSIKKRNIRAIDGVGMYTVEAFNGQTRLFILWKASMLT